MLKNLVVLGLFVASAWAYTMPATCACLPDAFSESIKGDKANELMSSSMTAGESFLIQNGSVTNPTIISVPIPGNDFYQRIP